MSKNIVVYSDGTGQDGGARPEQRISNIYKMYRISRDHADTAIDPSHSAPMSVLPPSPPLFVSSRNSLDR
jgi:hypothetical protein